MLLFKFKDSVCIEFAVKRAHMALPLERLIERLPSIPWKLKIGREIDRGAWGVVHEGKLSGEPVAVKKMHQMLVKGSEDGGLALRNFFDECKRLKDLDHPNVISEHLRGALHNFSS